MPLGDVHIMMFYGRPEKVSLTKKIREQILGLKPSIKCITITFLKYSFSVLLENKNN